MNILIILAKKLRLLLSNHSNYKTEAGTDEAGRGCLAGPVTAAAVILPEDFFLKELNDSKQLTEKTREKIRPIIEAKAIAFHYEHIEPEIIDKINILNASIFAMQESIKKLNPMPEYIIVDGNRFKPIMDIPYQCIIKGDSKYKSIAAASVLAKTYRDDYMNKIHEEFPMYHWNKNKGYPTKEHREAIAKYGVTKFHRISFRLLPDQYSLDL